MVAKEQQTINPKRQTSWYIFAAKVTELDRIRVGIVNYLNTKPLIYGLERDPVKDMIELVGAYPSRLAQML